MTLPVGSTAPADELERLQRENTALRRRVERERAARATAEAIGERATANLFSAIQSLRRSQSVLDETTDIVVLAEPDGRISYLNRAGCSQLGRTAEDPCTLQDLLGPNGLVHWRQEGIDAIARDGLWRAETELQRVDGPVLPASIVVLSHRDDEGRVEYYSAVARDVTDLRAAEAELSHQALHDSLTGLPNRTLFADRLAHAQARASRSHGQVAVLFLDLDRFKLVNDSLGHETGDALLVEVARLVQQCLRAGDTVARLGGDEFAVLVEEAGSTKDVVTTASRIIEALAVQMTVAGHEIYVSTSVGIAIGDSTSADLLRRADLAMYRAKERGRNRWELFERELDDRAAKRLAEEGELRHALAAQQFSLRYQPVMELQSGELTGVEALVRWEHPERGTLSPVDFIPLAEETGLITVLGEWVLRTACHQVHQWQQLPGRAGLTAAVNVSARQFQQIDLVERVLAVLEESGLPPASLVLEITETAVMLEPEQAARTMTRLAEHGVRFALDDFGQGYSSLGHLKRFPIDVVKIDKEFVDGLTDKAHDAQIVQAVLTMAQALHLEVTAEGIEQQTQVDELRQLGCDTGQGFHLARPLEPAGLTDLLCRPASAGETA